MRLAQRFGIGFVRRYNRLSVEGDVVAPSEPTLFVANHGFGGIFDLNAVAVLSAFDRMELDRPVTSLVHRIAWTLGVGPLLETVDAVPADADPARNALTDGRHVLVFPGGDLDAFKSHDHRNEIVFNGRSGFARLAIESGVPIVPIVTAGAGDTLYVLSDGQALAKALKLDSLLRLKALPVTLSFPWGLNVGLVGLLPYMPAPAKLTTRVLPAMSPGPEETAEEFAERVTVAMQETLDDLTGGRGA